MNEIFHTVIDQKFVMRVEHLILFSTTNLFWVPNLESQVSYLGWCLCSNDLLLFYLAKHCNDVTNREVNILTNS